MMATKNKSVKLNRGAAIALLETVALNDSASRNILISNVKQMFGRGTIKTLSAAENLINLIQDDRMTEFDAQMKKIDIAVNTKAAKRQASEIAQESNYTIQQRETSQHIIKVKTKTASCQPSS